MSFEQLGSLGELIGAIACVVLLVYIAIQIRHSSKMLEHNTRATEAATRQAFATIDQTYLCSAVDPSLGGPAGPSPTGIRLQGIAP